MSVFSRFLGQNDAGDSNGELKANPNIKDALSLQLLFAQAPAITAAEVAEALRSYHPSMSRARCEIDDELAKEGKVFGLIGWDKHVIRCVGFDAPMPNDPVEACVAPAHYPQELKEEARAHGAHVVLFYAGYEESPLDQYVALAATAGVLARFGAVVILNESARTSFPAQALTGIDSEDDMIELLQTLPLPILYCGFVKYEVEDVDGVWMRTHGAGRLGLPDFAALAEGHHQGQEYFDMFDNIFNYLLDSGATLAPGHTMQIGDDEFLRVRLPTDEEEFLADGGDLLIAEIIGADEINR